MAAPPCPRRLRRSGGNHIPGLHEAIKSGQTIDLQARSLCMCQIYRLQTCSSTADISRRGDIALASESESPRQAYPFAQARLKSSGRSSSSSVSGFKTEHTAVLPTCHRVNFPYQKDLRTSARICARFNGNCARLRGEGPRKIAGPRAQGPLLPESLRKLLALTALGLLKSRSGHPGHQMDHSRSTLVSGSWQPETCRYKARPCQQPTCEACLGQLARREGF